MKSEIDLNNMDISALQGMMNPDIMSQFNFSAEKVYIQPITFETYRDAKAEHSKAFGGMLIRVPGAENFAQLEYVKDMEGHGFGTRLKVKGQPEIVLSNGALRSCMILRGLNKEGKGRHSLTFQGETYEASIRKGHSYCIRKGVDAKSRALYAVTNADDYLLLDVETATLSPVTDLLDDIEGELYTELGDAVRKDVAELKGFYLKPGVLPFHRSWIDEYVDLTNRHGVQAKYKLRPAVDAENRTYVMADLTSGTDHVPETVQLTRFYHYEKMSAPYKVAATEEDMRQRAEYDATVRSAMDSVVNHDVTYTAEETAENAVATPVEAASDENYTLPAGE